jgi:squalene-hopene/tetraprenyl-beta-curcumene cyclase
MKLSAFLLILATVSAFGQAASQAPRHESLKQELRLSVERGLNFLRSKQNQETGQWGEAEPVAITGLAMTAFMLDPNRKPGDPVPCRGRKSHPLPHQQRQARRLHHHQGPRHLQHRHRLDRAAVEQQA